LDLSVSMASALPLSEDSVFLSFLRLFAAIPIFVLPLRLCGFA
jgi:hypothetical protein